MLILELGTQPLLRPILRSRLWPLLQPFGLGLLASLGRLALGRPNLGPPPILSDPFQMLPRARDPLGSKDCES